MGFIVLILFSCYNLIKFAIGVESGGDNGYIKYTLYDKYLKECGLFSDKYTQFECIFTKFDASVDRFVWLLTLPNLYPNTILYNEKVLEIEQFDEIIKNGHVEEPKFGSLFYRLPFNDYYKSIDSKISKLERWLNLPKIVIESNFGHTTPIDGNAYTTVHGLSQSHDVYIKVVILHLNYRIFRPIKDKVALYRFIYGGLSKLLYKSKFKVFIKKRIKMLKYHCRIITNENALLNLYNMTRYFSIDINNQLPFISLPGDQLMPLEFINDDREFVSLISSLKTVLQKKTGDRYVKIIKLIEMFLSGLILNEQRFSLKLDTFYVLEVCPKSYGYSLYNFLLPKDRLSLWNHVPKCIVFSHVYRLDDNLPFLKIGKIHLISITCTIVTFVSLLIYIIKC